MALHRLLGIDIGVPNPQTLDDFYQHIGFVGGDHSWGPKEAPDQIRVKEAPYRQLLEMRIACHSEEDLSEIAGRLDGIGIKHETSDAKLIARDPVNKFSVTIEPKEVADVPEPEPRPLNRPGNRPRKGCRPGVMTEPTLRPPRRLGCDAVEAVGSLHPCGDLVVVAPDQSVGRQRAHAVDHLVWS